jgi:hypothetical protein
MSSWAMIERAVAKPLSLSPDRSSDNACAFCGSVSSSSGTPARTIGT